MVQLMLVRVSRHILQTKSAQQVLAKSMAACGVDRRGTAQAARGSCVF